MILILSSHYRVQALERKQRNAAIARLVFLLLSLKLRYEAKLGRQQFTDLVRSCIVIGLTCFSSLLNCILRRRFVDGRGRETVMQWSVATRWSKLWIETEIYLLIKRRRVVKNIEQEKLRYTTNI
ncbi:hypothetical protein P8452_59219 [Trifolium repens]|nr:hypothetical protein P8452_59219 [Trifolium repens]